MRSKVLAIAVVAVLIAASAGGVYFFTKTDVGKSFLGKQDAVVVDYSDDSATVTPERVIIPDGIDISKKTEAQTIVNNAQTELDNLARSTKDEIVNLYKQADEWGKAHPEIEQALPFANMQSNGPYYRGIDENSKFTESALSYILRGKNICEPQSEDLKNQYDQKMRELCPELNNIFSKHGLTLTPEKYDEARDYDGYWCWDYDGAREDWVFTKPIPEGYSEAFFKDFYFREEYDELTNFRNLTTDLSNQMGVAQSYTEQFNDMISTYLQYCSESESQEVRSFVEQIDASQLEYSLRVAEIQADTQAALSALDWSE